MPLTPRTKKLLSYLLKLCLLALAFYFIYRGFLNNKANLYKFKMQVAHINQTSVVITLIFVLVFMLVNWLIESLKWRYLTRKFAPLSIWKSVESVFCGLTWAIFTPNRIGEYGGRIMFLPNRQRIHGVFAMGVGALGQNVTTVSIGTISLAWFLYTYVHLNNWILLGIVVATFGFMVLMLTFYFNIRWLVSLLNRIKFLRKYNRFFDIIGKYKKSELFKIMAFGVARFSSFTFQYYLILHLLIPQIPAVQIVMLMAVFFFVQTAIPSLDVLDVGVRSFTADKIFSYVTDQHIAILIAVSLIYIVNLIIPAIIGSVFVFRMKFFDSDG